jgi:purine-binding chemotaxis protein CheW
MDLQKIKANEKSSHGQGEKYLAFTLGQQEFGINLLKVKEIISLVEITHIPHTPHFVKGIINLRGNIVPVIDLRTKLGMEEIPYNERTCIIVIANPENIHDAPLSIAVDFVAEVLPIPDDKISEAPKMGSGFDGTYIHGIAKINKSIKILLNIDRVLRDAEIVDFASQLTNSSKFAEAMAS